MSILVDVRVEPPGFLFEEALRAAPSTEVRMIRRVGHPELAAPLLWAGGDAVPTFHRGLQEDSMVRAVTHVDRHQSSPASRILRVECDGGVPFLDAVDHQHGAVLDAMYRPEAWRVTLLLPGRSALGALPDDTIPGFEIRTVSSFRRAPAGPIHGLTDEQREALVATYRVGYFEIPREQTLSEVADEMDISANALSARLRRGFRTLVANTLIGEE